MEITASAYYPLVPPPSTGLRPAADARGGEQRRQEASTAPREAVLQGEVLDRGPRRQGQQAGRNTYDSSAYHHRARPDLSALETPSRNAIERYLSTAELTAESQYLKPLIDVYV